MRSDKPLINKDLEFGPFRLNPIERVLIRAGNPVAIPPKALEVLFVLVEHRGRVVPKQDLMTLAWPGVFIEDNTLAYTISVIRKILGDTSAPLRFIETVPKRGYRFIAPVTERDSEVPEQSDFASSGSPSPLRCADPPAPKMARSYLGAVCGVVAAVGIGLAVVHSYRTPNLTENNSIILADFTNSTSDSVLDLILRQGLAVELRQSPFLQIVSDQRIRHTMSLMGQPTDVPITPKLARDVCERIGSAAVLEGTVVRLGSHYVLGLRARNCKTGELFDDQQVEATRKEEVLDALSQMASKFRSRAGETLGSIREHSTPLAEATTQSLDALKAYTLGRRTVLSEGCFAGVPYFLRAIEFDPQLAMAHALLGLCYSDVGESIRAIDSTKRAYNLRNRAGDTERFFINFNYDRHVTGNLERAKQICELWSRSYPLEADPHALMSGYVLQGTGDYETSIAEAKKGIALDSDFAPAYTNLAYSYFYLDRLNEAETIIQIADNRGLGTPELYLLRYYIAFAKQNPTEMQRAASLAKSKSGLKDWVLHSEALATAHFGRLSEARNLSHAATDIAMQTGQSEKAAVYEAGIALTEALFQERRQARRHAEHALNLSKARDVEYGAALALGQTGDLLQVLALTNDLERRFPEDTAVRHDYVPTLRAVAALNRQKPAEAIEFLQETLSTEMAVPPVAFNAFYGGLYSAYVRGEAYVKIHKPCSGRAEYQKIVDHPGIVGIDPLGAIAHLKLARVLTVCGENVQAREEYKTLLAHWKDANGNIPLLKEARMEYAKLH